MNQYDILRQLVGIDSPVGYTQKACAYIFEILTSYGYTPSYTHKGAVKCQLGPTPTLAAAAHVDTLGAIVSGITDRGTLKISQIGGWPLNSFEGEYLKIITLDDKIFTGTFLLQNPSAHVNNVIHNTERRLDNMHIRLDEEVATAADVKKLGIRVGDIVCFDPRYQETSSGYIKSRFMDDKAGCYVLLEIARRLAGRGSLPVELFFSNYEEVGHGSAGSFSSSVHELLVVDMGVVGEGCQGNETCCSICAKDASGPYDYEFRKRLIALAEARSIPYQIDIFPFYSSDGSAALRAGGNFRVALIGQGVSASHGVERTHKKGIEATIGLTLSYIEDMGEKFL